MLTSSNNKINSPGIFIPICLYNQSFYFQKKNIEYLYTHFLKNYPKSLLFIADDLKAYNFLIKDEKIDRNIALEIARKQGTEIKNMVENTLKKFNDKSVRITKWIDLEETLAFKTIFQNVKNEIKTDSDLEIIVEQFIKYNLHKFGVNKNSESKIYERLYIHSEIAMSIFITEVLGYPTELWDKLPEINSPDPLKYLFENKRDVIKRITGKTNLDRRLLTLDTEQSTPTYLHTHLQAAQT